MRFPLSLWIACGLLSGCFLPVGPVFEDEQNYPPVVTVSDPAVGNIFTVVGQESDRDIRVAIADANLYDTLYVRWIFDYPKYDSAITRFAQDGPAYAPTGEPVRAEITLRPSCYLHQPVRGLTEHRLLLSVSDRPFINASEQTLSDEDRLDAVPEGAHRIRSFWLVRMDCGP
jgi:hypothetical protein